MSDAVNKPAHYNQGPIECIDAMQQILTPEEFRGFLKGNAFKYLWREKGKNGIEDLKKAKWYLDRLVNSLDEYEQQKASDLQSLKDHPFGKLKRPAWTPKIGDWVKIKKPENSVGWIEGMMDHHDGKIVQVADVDLRSIVHNGWYFRFDWLEPAQQPNAPLNSDTIPEGYRKLGDSSEELRQLGDLRWSVSEKRYVEISVDEIGYANRDNWAACRKITVEVTGEGTGEVKPPDGWRWLERGEVIRKGDRCFSRHGGSIDCLTSVGEKFNIELHYPTIRRNKFEVGEKVVRVSEPRGIVFRVKCAFLDNSYELATEGGLLDRLSGNSLAPYIEETK